MCDLKKVLIIILNYKTYDQTLKEISEFRKMIYQKYDILVIDNASPNESFKILNKYKDKLEYSLIESSINGGYAKGNNIGLKYACDNGYEYSLIINNDLQILDSCFLEKLIEKIDNDDEMAAVGPMIIDINNNIVAPYINRSSFASLTYRIFREKKERNTCKSKSQYVYRLYGCCMLVRNIYIKKVDFFDERTFLYCEEEILAEKFLKKNYKTYYLAESKIKHLESMTVGKKKGFNNLKKIFIVLDSLDIYLKDYLQMSFIKRYICKIFRFIIMFIKG